MAASEINKVRIPDVVLMGDLSRYDFLRWLLPEGSLPDWKDAMVWVQYGERDGFVREGTEWEASSCWTIPRMNLIVLPEEADLEQLQVKDETVFLIFEGDRFGKGLTEDKLGFLEGLHPETSKRIVLMDGGQRRASTDIEQESDAHAAEEQCADYLRRGWEAVCIRPSEADRSRQVLEVLNWQEPVERRWKRIMRAKREDMSAELDFLKDDEPFSVPGNALNRITRFETQRFAQQKSIWKAYCLTAEKILFDQSSESLLSWAAEEYTDTLEIVLDRKLFNEKKIRDSLEAELREAFRQKMKDAGMEQICLNEVTEPEYSREVNAHQLNHKFVERLTAYLKDAKERIRNRLWKEYEKLGGILK